MKYAQELFINIYSEMVPLVHANHKEVDLYGDPLELDIEGFLELEEQGVLKLFTMRCEENKLVGYGAFYIFKHPHHVNSIHANQDVFYVEQKKRGHASAFVRYCEQGLKLFGVSIVHQHSPAMKEWGTVLERNGYKKLETTYFKRI